MQDVTDLWTWIACYSDGSVEPENGRGFASAIRPGLTHIILVPTTSRLPNHALAVGDSVPIFFRRRTITEGSAEMTTIHCLGLTHDGDHSTYVFYLSDGSTVVSDDLNAV